MSTAAGSRTLAGVLSAQMSGEAGSAAALAPQELARITSEQRAVVNRYRGHVIRSDRELLATFDSVSAALSAGITLHRLAECAPDNSLARSVQVGLDSGDVFFSGRGCTGDIVEKAVRLCQAAQPGEFLLSRTAYALLGKRYPIQVESAGDELKLTWTRDPASAAQPFPPALELDRTPLAGRKRELQQLVEAKDAALQGQTRWVSVVGDSGMGKTRLISELASEAQKSNMQVLYGVAEEDTSPPYGPIVQALKFWIEAATDLDLALGVPSGELVRILPDLEERVPDLPAPTRSDADSERRQLFAAVADMLREISASAPVLLILDSLHWEGDPSFEMLREVLTHIRGASILVVATHQPGDKRTRRLLQRAGDCLGADAVAEVRLGRLSEEDVASLLRSAGRGYGNLAAAVHLVTRGLPLHVMAMLGSEMTLTASSLDLPRSVRDAMRQRLESLDPSERQVVQVAAVLGERFTALNLAELLRDSDRAFEVLDKLSEEGFFREINPRTLTYQFIHSMMREAAVDLLGGARAARLHERAGLALEECGELERERRVFDLARHFTRAAPLGYMDRAVLYSSRAALQALDQHANEDAAELFRDALDLLPEDGEERTRCELEIGLGRALNLLGKQEFREVLMTAADRAQAIGDGELMARALLSSYRGTFSRAVHVEEELVRRMRDALTLLSADNTATRARLTSHLAVELVWADDPVEAQLLGDEAIQMAEALRDTRVLIEVLAHHQWALFHPLSERIAIADRLHDLHMDHLDPRLSFEIANHEVFTWIRAGDRIRYQQALELANSLADEIDEPSVRSLMLLRNTAAALMEARFADAETLMNERRDLEQSIGALDGEAAWRVHNFWLNFETLPLEQGQGLVRKTVELGLKHLPPFVYWAPLAAYAAEVNMADLVKPMVTQLAENNFGSIPKDQLWLCNLCELALAVVAMGDTEKAKSLCGLLTPHRNEIANTVFMTLGSVARYVGLLCDLTGHAEEAEQHLRDAITANEQMGAVSWLTRCQLDLAQLLWAGRDGQEEAQALAEDARARASQLGLARVLLRTEELIMRQRDGDGRRGC